MNGALTQQPVVLALRLYARRASARVLLPDGSEHIVGPGPPMAEIRVLDNAVYARIARGGGLGFVECYLDGLIDTDDVRAMYLWAAANHAPATGPLLRRALSPISALWQRLAATERHERVGSIVDHYNLGNEFYAHWLDETMTYSAAEFGSEADESLEDAQRRKYAMTLERSEVREGAQILEIGCGWGGFAEYATDRGAGLTGVTIASEQADFCEARLSAAINSGSCEILLRDFRDVEGQWDATVSIEMIESIEETLWPELFACFKRNTTPGGPIVMQAITIADDRFDAYARREDFIQRYIFPGGQLPSKRRIEELAGGAGLTIERLEEFGGDYARTLERWAQSFESAWPTVRQMGFDDKFRRIWMSYLGYCEGGFRSGQISVGRWTFRA